MLVQLHDSADPETGHRYTVKQYEIEKAKSDDSWQHQKVVLKPVNPRVRADSLEGSAEGSVTVIAEVIDVLGTTLLRGQ